MTEVQLHDKHFRPYINNKQIQQRISELATEINHDYAELNPLFIGILNGSFIFAADLFRAVTIKAEISFIKLASYRGTSSTGSVITAIGLEDNLHDRHIIILEDIVDTGRTLFSFLPVIEQQSPASVRIAAFLSKPDARQHEVPLAYTGFEIPDKFVVGYGLDYDKLGRNLPELYILTD